MNFAGISNLEVDLKSQNSPLLWFPTYYGEFEVQNQKLPELTLHCYLDPYVTNVAIILSPDIRLSPYVIYTLYIPLYHLK